MLDLDMVSDATTVLDVPLHANSSIAPRDLFFRKP